MNILNTIPLAVLSASILGSGHCVAMCGGLIITAARDRKSILVYHLGRLLGYCGLGAVAGYLGETVFQSQTFAAIPWFATAFLSMGFILIGVRLWFRRPLHFFSLSPSLWRKLAGLGPGGTGFFSAFLPCGWLHTFILGAIATQSATLGAIYLFFFWLGTLPALSFGPLAATKILFPIFRRVPRLSAVILIAIGLSNIGIKMIPIYKPISTHCHELEIKNSGEVK